MLLTIANPFVRDVIRCMEVKYHAPTVLIICDEDMVTIDFKQPIDTPDISNDDYVIEVKDTKLLIKVKYDNSI